LTKSETKRIIRKRNVIKKGCEKEEYTYTLYREGYPLAERYLKEQVCGR